MMAAFPISLSANNTSSALSSPTRTYTKCTRRFLISCGIVRLLLLLRNRKLNVPYWHAIFCALPLLDKTHAEILLRNWLTRVALRVNWNYCFLLKDLRQKRLYNFTAFKFWITHDGRKVSTKQCAARIKFIIKSKETDQIAFMHIQIETRAPIRALDAF